MRTLRERNDELQRENAAADAKVSNLSEAVREREALLRDLTQQLEQTKRQEERAVQDLRFFKSTTMAEMERQQQALVAANEIAKDSAAEAQSSKQEVRKLEQELGQCQLKIQEQQLELSRAQKDAQRLRSELELLRKVQGELHVEIRKLQVVNQQRDSQVADLRQQVQEGARSSDLTQQQVQMAADRLRRANDGVAALLQPDLPTPRGQVPATPRLDHSQGAELEGEVGRAEKGWEQLHGVLQKQRWERKADADKAEADRRDAEEKLSAMTSRSVASAAESSHLQRLLGLNAGEHRARGLLCQEEGSAWSGIARSIGTAKSAVMRERMLRLEQQDTTFRRNIAHWAQSETMHLRTVMDHSVVALAAHARYDCARQVQDEDDEASWTVSPRPAATPRSARTASTGR
eukprot:TRINITY_DN4383_c0_g1_i2.p1 TRINITY_DN4383_c0_g1~~TRINITY_DN4383_c0_g1_i2.p1  ORF type:complete len:405 (+),score=141.09 TRINITY_DN4383_c0_g1_i2:625-1839(+)